MPPNDPGNCSKMKDRIFPFNGLFDCSEIPEIAANLRAAQRLGVGGITQIEECNRVAHVTKLLGEVASNETIAPGYQNFRDALSPHLVPASNPPESEELD